MRFQPLIEQPQSLSAPNSHLDAIKKMLPRYQSIGYRKGPARNWSPYASQPSGAASQQHRRAPSLQPSDSAPALRTVVGSSGMKMLQFHDPADEPAWKSGDLVDKIAVPRLAPGEASAGSPVRKQRPSSAALIGSSSKQQTTGLARPSSAAQLRGGRQPIIDASQSQPQLHPPPQTPQQQQPAGAMTSASAPATPARQQPHAYPPAPPSPSASSSSTRHPPTTAQLLPSTMRAPRWRTPTTAPASATASASASASSAQRLHARAPPPPPPPPPTPLHRGHTVSSFFAQIESGGYGPQQPQPQASQASSSQSIKQGEGGSGGERDEGGGDARVLYVHPTPS